MKKLPINVHDFKELIDQDCYYVDKTKFIEKLINEYVVIYTRPKCFGKTLNMSMLYYFFSNNEKDNAYLFDGLKVTDYPEVMKHQNQYPVIFISLKELDNPTFQSQINLFSNIVFKILDENYKELLTSDQLSDARKEILNQLAFQKASIDQLKVSLETISQALYQHYHKKVVILIDEDDVYQAVMVGDAEKLNKILNSIFENRISYYDNKENFYHGCLFGLLGDHNPFSNRESGDGRFDICLEPGETGDTAVIIECKHSKSEKNLESDASKGLKQIIEKKYGSDITNRSVKKIIGYGIAFYKKKCYVVSENLQKNI